MMKSNLKKCILIWTNFCCYIQNMGGFDFLVMKNSFEEFSFG